MPADDAADEMLNDLEGYESNLSKWELGFYQSLCEIRDSGRTLSDQQRLKLIEVWEHHCL
jgi:hypothetical protein